MVMVSVSCYLLNRLCSLIGISRMIFNLVGYAAADMSDRYSLDSLLLSFVRIFARECASRERGPIGVMLA